MVTQKPEPPESARRGRRARVLPNGLRRRLGPAALAVSLTVAGLSAGTTGPVEAVVGGVAPNGNEAPWAVKINITTSAGAYAGRCTGSVIAPRYVLTAAHCVSGEGNPPFSVEVGGLTWNITTAPLIAPAATVGDAAILVLPADAGVPAVRLAPSQAFVDSFTNRGVTFFGWGATKMSFDNKAQTASFGSVSTTLRKTPDGAFYKSTGCQSGFGPAPVCFMKPKTLAQDPTWVAAGDSGGPWVAWSNGGWVQIGIHKGSISTITKQTTGPEGGPSVGAPATQAWIQSIIAPSTPPPPPPTLYAEQEGSHGANTFTNYHNASGMGTPIAAGQWVNVSCKVYDPYIASVNPDGYWYRLADSPWNNQYYAAANTFMNGDPWGGPYTHNTDWNVPNC